MELLDCFFIIFGVEFNIGKEWLSREVLHTLMHSLRYVAMGLDFDEGQREQSVLICSLIVLSI
jgi:hypothetical protein